MRKFPLVSALMFSAATLLTGASSTANPRLAPIRVDKDKQYTVTFSRIVLRIKGSSEVGLAPDSFRILLLEKLRKLNYPALGAESLVFDQDKSEKARYAVGGTIDELECRRGLGDNRECVLAVQWELQDRQSSEIVYRVKTRYAASATTPEKLGQRLIIANFYSLLSREKFSKLMLKDQPENQQAPSYPPATFQSCPAKKLDMPSKAEASFKSTVLIEMGNRLSGSGAVLSPDGLVLTAAHVVDRPDPITVQFRDGGRVAAKLVRINSKEDVALLHFESQVARPCSYVRELPMRVGDEVFAIGSPLSKELSFTLTRGIVSGIRELNGSSWLQTDASINPGNSGGPLLDKDGGWAAVVSWKVVGSSVQGIAFGIPVPAALKGLGLSRGEHTDASLRIALPQATAREDVTVEDEPDDPIVLGRSSSNSYQDTYSFDEPVERAPKTESSDDLGYGGLVLVGAGAGLGTFAAISDSLDGTSKKLMYGLSGVAVAGGLAVLVVPLFSTKKSPDPTVSRVGQTQAVSLGVGPQTVSFFGSF